MPDYQKSKIYKLWSPSKNLVYYGSTTQTLSQRFAEHIRKKRNKDKCYSCLVLDCEDYKIELVEEYPCNNRQQLMKKEGEYIKNNECVNKNVAGRTDLEYRQDNKEHLLKYHKIYRENNGEKLKERCKKYRENHKEKITEYRENNKQQIKEYKKSYYENNKQQISEYKKSCYETKKQNNAIYEWLLEIIKL